MMEGSAIVASAEITSLAHRVPTRAAPLLPSGRTRIIVKTRAKFKKFKSILKRPTASTEGLVTSDRSPEGHGELRGLTNTHGPARSAP
jgi:hypothetical protein